MIGKTFKNILNNIPTGVILLDKKYNVKFTNMAFKQFFSSAAKGAGSLKDVLCCVEDVEKCGEGVKCAYCSFRSVFREAMEGSGVALKKIIMTVDIDGEEKNVALKLKVKPVQGNYYIGLLDDCYELEIAKEMQSAQNIQQRLLPVGNMAGGVPYYYMYLPCREIGGDLPDVYEIGRDTVGVIADVSGKGISAGMLSAFVKAGWDKKEVSPAAAIQKLNDKFAELNMDERSYITAAAVHIDSDDKIIRYSVAGHIVPILMKSGLRINEITYQSPPISNWLEQFQYIDHEMSYRTGDILVLLTDGVTESKNKNGEQFGVERVEGVLLRSRNAESFIERLKSELHSFCDSFDDDLTAIAFDLV